MSCREEGHPQTTATKPGRIAPGTLNAVSSQEAGRAQMSSFFFPGKLSNKIIKEVGETMSD